MKDSSIENLYKESYTGKIRDLEIEILNFSKEIKNLQDEIVELQDMVIETQDEIIKCMKKELLNK